MTFVRGGSRFRPKNVYLLKNAMIGVGWALLPVIGAAGASVPGSLIVFVGLQVLIGSTVRDIADVEEDRRHGVRSLPVVHGVERTLTGLEIVNLACVPALVLLALSGAPALAIGLLLPVAWRVGVLRLIRRSRTTKLLQAATLATCHLILVGAIVGQVLS
jgi:4-hydroxybenzoate polyprenyltransferase